MGATTSVNAPGPPPGTSPSAVLVSGITLPVVSVVDAGDACLSAAQKLDAHAATVDGRVDARLV